MARLDHFKLLASWSVAKYVSCHGYWCVGQVIPTLHGGDAPLQCVQRPGDLVYSACARAAHHYHIAIVCSPLFLTISTCAVPSRWGHTTLNLTPTVGVAIGFRTKDVEAAKLVVDSPRTCAAIQQVDEDRGFADLRTYAGSSAQTREL